MQIKPVQLFLSLIAIAMMGCDNKIDVKNLLNQPESLTTIRSSSGTSQLSIPSSWKRQFGNRTKDGHLYDIQVGLKSGDSSVFVIEEPLIDFDRNYGINIYTELTLGFITEELKQARIFSGPFNVHISGMPGRQHVIHGTIDGIKIVVLHTTLKGQYCFYQVLATTSPSHLEEGKEELLKIVRSFQESPK